MANCSGFYPVSSTVNPRGHSRNFGHQAGMRNSERELPHQGNHMGDFVKETDINYYEIWKRGGANGGDEDYALFRCPKCRTTYLIDYEVDTVFLDADDLARRVSISGSGDSFPCVSCGRPLASHSIWKVLRVEDDTADWRVTWDSIRSSPWAWAVEPNASNDNELV